MQSLDMAGEGVTTVENSLDLKIGSATIETEKLRRPNN